MQKCLYLSEGKLSYLDILVLCSDFTVDISSSVAEIARQTILDASLMYTRRYFLAFKSSSFVLKLVYNCIVDLCTTFNGCYTMHDVWRSRRKIFCKKINVFWLQILQIAKLLQVTSLKKLLHSKHSFNLQYAKN